MTTHAPLLMICPRVMGLSLLAAAFLTGCEVMPVALEEPINVSVEGRVTDAETGAPLDSVVVYMWRGIILNDETYDSVTTDAGGLYAVSQRFQDECPSDLHLNASDRPFDYQSETVDLECTDGNRQVNFELTRRENADPGSND